jgi:hypothetical protein
MILKNGQDWQPTDAQWDIWERAYPALNVYGELLKMDAWLLANPTRRKTERGMPKAVVAWLGRAKPDRFSGARPQMSESVVNEVMRVARERHGA